MSLFTLAYNNLFSLLKYNLITQEDTDLIFPHQLPTTTPETCIIIDMPLEIIHLIADLIPGQSRLILSTTCRNMNRALYNRVHRDREQFSVEDHFEYLYTSVGQDSWVYACELCYCVHRADPRDFPWAGEYYFTCPKANTSTPARDWERDYDIRFRHAQLVLRFNRLKTQGQSTEAQNSYLRDILTSRADERRLQSGCRLLWSYWPRIRSGQLLICKMWNFRYEGKVTVSRDIFPEFSICPHQNTQRITDINYPRQWSILSRVMDRAIERHDGERQWGRCPRCNVDFCAYAFGRRSVWISCYYNLGPELIFMNSHWIAHKLIKEALEEKYFAPGKAGLPNHNTESPHQLYWRRT